jgi:hypothetical protein
LKLCERVRAAADGFVQNLLFSCLAISGPCRYRDVESADWSVHLNT